MSNEAIQKLFECRGEGMVVTPTQTPAVLEETKIVKTEEDQLPPSPKEEFDANVVTNGLVDSPKEGGATIARSTGMSGMADKAVPGTGLGFVGGEGPYELSGFTVQYDVPDSTDIGAVEVIVSFPTIDEAKSKIARSGAKTIYNHTTPKGVSMVCTVTKDAPVICVNECEKLRFIEGDWVKA